MATLTSSLYANQGDRTLKSPHIGVVTLAGTHNTSATTASAGDVLFLCKIPHGAKIVNFVERHSTGATAHAISVGLARGWATGGSASLSCILASGAQATVNFKNVDDEKFPTISVSDGDTLRYGVLAAKLGESGTGTTSLKISWSVSYTMDPATE